jgi:hypothetical protein
VVELYLAMVLVQSGACDVSWQPGSVDAVTVEHTEEQSPAIPCTHCSWSGHQMRQGVDLRRPNFLATDTTR